MNTSVNIKSPERENEVKNIIRGEGGISPNVLIGGGVGMFDEVYTIPEGVDLNKMQLRISLFDKPFVLYLK